MKIIEDFIGIDQKKIKISVQLKMLHPIPIFFLHFLDITPECNFVILIQLFGNVMKLLDMLLLKLS